MEHVRSHPVELVGLVDGALELHRPESRRLVDQRAHGRGDGESRRGRAASPSTASVRRWARIPRSRLRLSAGTETSIKPPCSDPESPQRRGTAVAQHRIRPAGEHRRHPAPVSTELRSAPRRRRPRRRGCSRPGGDPPLDPAGTEPKLKQLPARDRAVLSPDQGPDRRIASGLIRRAGHLTHASGGKGFSDEISPPGRLISPPLWRQQPPARSASSSPSPAWTGTTAGPRSSPGRCATRAWR